MERIVHLLSRLPVSIHYWLSDWVLFPIVYYIIRYRRKLVHKNLSDSFPEYTPREIRRLEKKFYHHLADIIVEMVYGYGLSGEEMSRRVHFDNHALVKQMVDNYGSVIVMLAHLGNWEWLTDYNRQYLAQDNILQANIYRKQANKYIDNLLQVLRSKRGGILIDKQTILRQMILLRKEGKRMFFALICDQKPRPQVARYWTDFLHHDTGFLDGGEVLAKKFNYPVLYASIHSSKRGYYEVSFELLSEHPAQTAENEITAMYAERLEQNIIDQPEQWLWTHNRWKWARQVKNNETNNPI